MCGCKNCKEITLLAGNDGKGIVSMTLDPETQEIIVLYTDGTTYTFPSVSCECHAINIVGEDDIVVESVTDPSGDVTYTISRPKEFLYEETVDSVDISLDPNFVPLTYFSPTDYTNLIYTNTTGVTKTYKVHVSYEHSVGSLFINDAVITSWVDAAIVKNSTVMYEMWGQLNLSSYLFYGTGTNDIIPSGLPLHELLDTQGSPVTTRFLLGYIPLNAAFFKTLTLAPGETVSLQFRTKDPTAEGQPALALLRKAQIMVEEL
jgi:hypothetical protein